MQLTTKPIDNNEKKFRLRLIRSENIGPITFNQLILRFGNAEKALAAIPNMAQKGGAKRKIKISSEKDAISEAAKLRDMGGKFFHKGEDDYPSFLTTMDDAPPILSLLGNGHLLKKQSFAIIGARNASTNAKRMAQQFATNIGKHDMVITSGLARGIDRHAHIGAFENGTIAVVAGGVDVIYPNENKDIYEEIIKLGAVISEMPLATKPQARHFPRRNRIISGISWGVLIVEAALRSGSLITARFANEQGREVFATPGSPLDARSKGTNNLIRLGAHLCENIDDILNIYNSLSSQYLSENQQYNIEPTFVEDVSEKEITNYRDRIIEAIGNSPVAIDDIIRQLDLPFPIIWVVLMELELAGRLERLPAGHITLLQNIDI